MNTEFTSMRDGQNLRAAYEEQDRKPAEKSIGELCEDGAGRVGVCRCCAAVAVIGNAMHVCRECFEYGEIAQQINEIRKGYGVIGGEA